MQGEADLMMLRPAPVGSDDARPNHVRPMMPPGAPQAPSSDRQCSTGKCRETERAMVVGGCDNLQRIA